MTWLPLTFSLLMVALVAVPMLFLPLLARPQVPLGVNVPAGYEHEPAVAAAKRRYVQLSVVAIAISVVAAVVLRAMPVAGMLVPTFFTLAATMASYMWARRGIIRAKARGQWYAGARVRVAAPLTAGPAERPPMQWGWYAASVVLLSVGFIVGAARYGALPDPMPVHWGIDGQPNRFAAKSVASVFMPMFVCVGLVILMFVVARFLPRGNGTEVHGARVVGALGARAASNRAQAYDQLRVTIGIIGALNLVVTAMMVGTSIATWSDPAAPLANSVLIAGTGLIAAVLIIGVWLYVKTNAPASAESASGSAANVPAASGAALSEPDDDRYWKAGLVYVNRENPALWVPKRVGIGWTINMGHRGSWAIIAGLLLFVAASIVLPLLLT